MNFSRAWQIFSSSIVELFRNFRAALYISLPWYVPTGIAFVSIEIYFDQLNEASIRPAGILIAGVVIFLVCVTPSIIAVGWHRFVLRGEKSSGLIPFDRHWPILRYFINGTLLVLVGILFWLPVSFVASLFGAPTFFWSNAETDPQLPWLILYGTAFFYGTLRFGLKLPAVAVENDSLGFSSSWARTRPIQSELLGVAILLSLIYFGPLALIEWSFGEDARLGKGRFGYGPTLLEGALTWPATMIEINILTKLYGDLREDQPL